MDLTKAQRLLNKIQAFLDNGNGHELSRLEKDLIKSYVQQLYEAVTMEEESGQDQSVRSSEVFEKKIVRSEIQKTEKPQTSAFETQRSEQEKQPYQHVSPVNEKYDPPVYPEYKPQEEKTEAKISKSDLKTANEIIDTPAYTPYKTPEEKTEAPPYVPYVMPEEKTEAPPYVEPDIPSAKKHASDPVYSEPEKSAPTFNEHNTYTHQPAKETFHTSQPNTGHGDEDLLKLFDLQKSDEMSSRFGHVPIGSIESAMGLNERIFTLNELFGGDKALFDAWCAKLNSLNSFTEAKNVLMAGPAKDFKWSDPQRIKMAEQFIRIVSRRYPKSAV